MSKQKHFMHGMIDYPEYKVWLGMRDRCNNKNQRAYSYYGARGIKVCKRWDNFANFIEDMGRRPKDHSIDRIDNNGDYEPKNCRWADKMTQANNTRDNRTVKYGGDMYKLRELSNKCGVPKKLLEKRIFERGWSIERAVINKSFIGRNQYSM